MDIIKVKGWQAPTFTFLGGRVGFFATFMAVCIQLLAKSKLQALSADLAYGELGLVGAFSPTNLQKAASTLQKAASTLQKAASTLQIAASTLQKARYTLQKAGSRIQKAGSRMQKAGYTLQIVASTLQIAGCSFRDFTY